MVVGGISRVEVVNLEASSSQPAVGKCAMHKPYVSTTVWRFFEPMNFML